MTSEQRPGDMVQVHMLASYPASLLNRDDTGLAKRIPFGGKVRTRVSSQCLKKHWRESAEVSLHGDLAHRSRGIYERLVAHPLVEGGVDESVALLVAEYLIEESVGSEASDGARSKQILVLTHAETDFLTELARDTMNKLQAAGVMPEKVKDVKDNAPLDDKELRKTIKELPADLDTALFGRFITGDLFAKVDAAVSVAHAFTTHAEASETDYFTAMDSLSEEEESGAGLIQDAELTSGVFYLYVVLDMNQLKDNLGGQADIAEDLGTSLVRAMATVSPGAKKGSTAPYTYAEFVLLERGSSQPRTLANAFLDPVTGSGAGVMQESVDRLLTRRAALEEMYGDRGDKAHLATIHRIDERLSKVSFDEALRTTFDLRA